jgi:hypothetical protein
MLTGPRLVKKPAFYVKPKLNFHIYKIPKSPPILSHTNPIHLPNPLLEDTF